MNCGVCAQTQIELMWKKTRRNTDVRERYYCETWGLTSVVMGVSELMQRWNVDAEHGSGFCGWRKTYQTRSLSGEGFGNGRSGGQDRVTVDLQMTALRPTRFSHRQFRTRWEGSLRVILNIRLGASSFAGGILVTESGFPRWVSHLVFHAVTPPRADPC